MNNTCPSCKSLVYQDNYIRQLQVSEALESFLKHEIEMCPIHDADECIYCEQCQELVCFECKEQNHKDHPA